MNCSFCADASPAAKPHATAAASAGNTTVFNRMEPSRHRRFMPGRIFAASGSDSNAALSRAQTRGKPDSAWRRATLDCALYCTQEMPMRYELYYWPSIQGRGEFVRLALEEAAADYVDVAREKGGTSRMMRLMEGATVARPPFAPPFLKAGRLLVAQTANILLFLAGRHGLAPRDEAGRLWTNQLQLTLADLVVEAHDTHHPIAAGLYYEDQKPAARRRAEDFRRDRIPKFLGYFERVLERNPRGDRWLVGARLTYADLSL